MSNASIIGADIGQMKGEAMSLIIKGIDKSKYARTFRIYPSGKVLELNNEGLLDNENPYQAIQIPTPHGRLIDGDETRTQYYQTMDELLQSTTINISAEALSLLCGFTLINNAPTILESEESDESDIERD